MATAHFGLKRPCANCPFRIGSGSRFQLHPGRLESIRHAPAFQCHKTVDYDRERPRPSGRPQQCAGLMAVLHREGAPNQIMQVAQRLAAFDAAQLDPDGEAYASWADVLAAHDGREP